MKRIIVHWTAGVYKPNATDLEHYHYLIDDGGNVYEGNFKPEDNENCNDGRYAAHTGGGNTGSIGISLCGMSGFVNRADCGAYPLTKVQCERAFKLIAELSKKYNIQITPQTVMTHYEFGLKHPNTTSRGKIDIVYLPPYPEVEQAKIGDFIRNKTRWYKVKREE